METCEGFTLICVMTVAKGRKTESVAKCFCDNFPTLSDLNPCVIFIYYCKMFYAIILSVLLSGI